MRFFHQEDLNDCGFACLAMMINHYQKQKISPYQLKKINPEINNNGGVTFFDLISLAANFGLKGTAYFCEFNLLLEQKQLPILVNIKGENDLNHFVLLTKIAQTNVQLLDPALKFGRRELKWVDFKDIYLGQILIFQKVKKWQPQIPWKRIFDYAKSHWFWLVLTTLTMIVTNYLWFLANFFIRHLEDWLINDHLNYLIFVQFGFYLLGGGLNYFLQLYCLHHMQQSLWRQLLTTHLNKLHTSEHREQQNHDFWELVNHQHQILNLFFVIITKFLSNLALFPSLIWTISQSNYWILLVTFLFIIVNSIINNFCFRMRAKLRDREDWEKSNYYQHIAVYVSNFSNFKKRQYDQTNYQILQTKQTQYFKTEQHNYSWIALSDLNQQLSQRIFNLVFWFLIFFLILNGQMPLYDLLILSVMTQLLLNLSMDWIHNFIWFHYQKTCLFGLPILSIKLQSRAISLMKKSNQPLFHLEHFGFEIPGHFYQLPILTFKFPLQIHGSPQILDGFYQACLNKKSSLFIDNRPLIDYEKELFAIDYQAVPLAPIVSTNLFLNQSINQEYLDKINLDYWLKKYNLELFQTINIDCLNKEQLQVMSFLSLLFSNYQLYFLNQPLNAVADPDKKRLWELLFELKGDKCLVILGDVSLTRGIEISHLNLDNMI